MVRFGELTDGEVFARARPPNLLGREGAALPMQASLTCALIATLAVALATGQETEPKRLWEVKGTNLPTVLEQQFPNDPLIRAGLLPVTHHGADPTGVKDSTAAIQAAIDAAYDHGLACFFPTGSYRVSAQLVCRQPRDYMTQSHVLIGSASGPRPVLRLVDSAAGFGDPERPKPVVLLQAVNDQGREEVPSAYDLQFRGIDLELGQGNAGAVGVYLHGAQGCTVQDVKVSGPGPFHAGFQHLIGSGGGVQNLEVVGGRYAIDAANDSAKHPCVVGLRAIDQTDEVIRIGTATVITVVGLEVVRDRGPCFVLKKRGNECSCHLSLIDAVIRYREPGQTVIDNVDRSVYLQNVFVEHGGTVVANQQGPQANAIGNADGWGQVQEYSYYHRAGSRLVDGRGPEPNDPPLAGRRAAAVSPAAVPRNIIGQHVWDSTTFPHAEANGVINVGDPPYGAVPNDDLDDAAALQRAIDDGAAQDRPVFIPKGEYHLGRTLLLHANTKLFGVARNLTILNCLPDWQADTPTPMIDTDDAADATTVLAFMRLEMPQDLARRIYHLRWRAGRHSMVREVWFEKPGNWGPLVPIAMLRVLVTGHGGGRWYNVFHRAGHDAIHPDHRYLLLDGTSEPFNLYTYCPEYAEADCAYQFEFRNSQNISVFGLKAETALKGREPVPTCGITGCDNVFIAGNTGIGEAPEGRGIIEVRGSTNVTIANCARWGKTHSPTWYYVLDLDRRVGLAEAPRRDSGSGDNHTASLFKLGDCRPLAIVP